MASSTGDSDVLSLARLIHETTGKLVQQYNSAGYSVPSLDSTDPGPFDASEKAPAELTRNIHIIEGACAQLSMAISKPSLVINNKAYSFLESTCLKVVHEAKIADRLLNAPNGIHIDELAVKSGLNAGKLGRVLRFLATAHCFKEVKPDVFANNRISVQLCSDNPVSSWAGFLVDEPFTAGCYLSDTISNPEFASSLSPDHTPFRKAFGSNFFDFLQIPSNTRRKERFAKAMIGTTEIAGKYLIARAVPWASAESLTICDVAGGNGHITLDLAKKFPNLRVILQDLPIAIEQAKQYWKENLPDAVETKRVQFAEFDFFKDSPAPDCKWYLLSHILHDWPDAECVKILSNIRKVMSPDSRLLIYEFVLQYAVQESETNETGVWSKLKNRVTSRPSKPLQNFQAPNPLLQNYGLGGILPYRQDILMMTLLNSRERKLEEFILLAEKSGFKYEKLSDAGEEKLVEFSVAQGFQFHEGEV